MLADSSNGYTWGWQLYAGKENSCGDRGLAHHIVVQLVSDPRLEGKGYVVYCDNFISSPDLFKELKERGFGACGTCRIHRRGLPAIVRATRLRKGQVISVIEEGLMSLKWHDKRDVTMLSTIHDASMVTKSRRSRGAEGRC